MKKNKALLNITDPIFEELAPTGSLLRDCLTNSKWDDKNDNSNASVHYNTRLAVSKLLRLIKTDKSEELVKLFSTPSKALAKKDVIQGFKTAELLLKRNLPISRTKAYSTSFRRFIKQYGHVLSDGSSISNTPYQPQQDLAADTINQKSLRVSTSIEKGKTEAIANRFFYLLSLATLA